MNGLREEYVELVRRWNELSDQRELLLQQLNVFEETRGHRPPSDGESEFRRRLFAAMDESMSVAYRAQQIAQLPQPFGPLGRRRRMFRAQQLWFQNIKRLTATRWELEGLRP